MKKTNIKSSLNWRKMGEKGSHGVHRSCQQKKNPTEAVSSLGINRTRMKIKEDIHLSLGKITHQMPICHLHLQDRKEIKLVTMQTQLSLSSIAGSSSLFLHSGTRNISSAYTIAEILRTSFHYKHPSSNGVNIREWRLSFLLRRNS